MKRREKKQIELTDGHLVLELPVARSLAQLAGGGGMGRGESEKLRCELKGNYSKFDFSTRISSVSYSRYRGFVSH